jgi:cytochrome c oxidase subunit 2
VRPAAIAAGVLVVAAAGMAVAAFAGGDGEAPPPRAAATATPAAARAPDGLAVWAREGCGGCHTFAAANSHGPIGPDLGASLRKMPAAYVKESIVAPDAAIAAGYAAGTMPEDYAERIAPDDLDRLVAFIVGGVPDD